MFKKILIANRGEIACRIIRTAKSLGVTTVAIYSDADQDAMHVTLADEAFWVGAAPSSESYLNIERIVSVCKENNVEAVHPGYGFLSENPDFVDALEAEGITFVGPSADAIRAMGLKDAAKELMVKAGVPVVPGYQGEQQDVDFLAKEAERIGYPVLIKARAGGGGKGMRRVNKPGEFVSLLESAQREAAASFGDSHVLIEKYIEKPRHIEFQIFGDNHGNVIHLFERDCSLQRRHQKVIEEAPAPDMPEDVRQIMGKEAKKAAKAVNYSGAGTVEFIVDVSDGLQADRFYFMEMNTRLQVEHPVTEYITGLDLVALQLRVAAGEKLSIKQKEVTYKGWSFEARLYAEDVPKGFLPSTGTLHHLKWPEGDEGIRIDTGVTEGDTISPYYDPMIAKLITYGENRDTALAKMKTALRSTQIAGCTTNIAFLDALCNHKSFVDGDVDTNLIEENLDQLIGNSKASDVEISVAALKAMGLVEVDIKQGPWQYLKGWRSWGKAQQYVQMEHSGEVLDVAVTFLANDSYLVNVGAKESEVTVLDVNKEKLTIKCGQLRSKLVVIKYGQSITVINQHNTFNFRLNDLTSSVEENLGGGGKIVAPMPGLIREIKVKKGQAVRKGDVLILMEAMKMEHSLTAPSDGIVTTISTSESKTVTEGTVLLTMESEDAAKGSELPSDP